MDNFSDPHDAKNLLGVFNCVGALESYPPNSVSAEKNEVKVNGISRPSKVPSDPKPKIPRPRKPKVEKTDAEKAAIPPKSKATPRKRSTNPTPRPRVSASKSIPSPVTQTFSISNTPPVSVFQNAYVPPPMTVSAQASLTSTPSQTLRGARTILPKPPGGQTTPAIRPAPPVTPSNSSPQLTSASLGNVPNNVFQNGSVINPANLQNNVLIGGQPFNFGGLQFLNSLQFPQHRVLNDKPSEGASPSGSSAPSAAGGLVQPPRNSAPPPSTVQVQLQTIQTPNGPMMVAFLPNQLNAGQSGFGQLPQQGPRFQLMQNNGGMHHMQSSFGQNISTPPALNNFTHNTVMPPVLANYGQTSVTPPPSYANLSYPANLGMQFQEANNVMADQVNCSMVTPPSDVSLRPVSEQGSMSMDQRDLFSEPSEKKQKFEPEFNLEDFLTFGTSSTFPEPVTASENPPQQPTRSILEELVTGPMFQSVSFNGVVPQYSHQTINALPPAVVPLPVPEKKKRVSKPRKKKSDQPDQLKMKVEEILKKCDEEMKKETIAKPVIAVAAPPASVSTLLPVATSLPKTVVVPPVRLPPPTPSKPILITKPPTVPPRPHIVPILKPIIIHPPAPPPVVHPPVPNKVAKRKTDLALKDEKDVKMLEKLDLKLPFKGMTSSMNRLLPFHLLSEPEERPELIERETRAFSLMSHALVLREKALYERFMRQIIADAALPVSNLDSLTCTSTWIEAEREEFEAEKLAVREGQPVEPPPSWVYSDLKIEPNVPFFGPNYLDCFAEPSPAEDFTALSNFQPSSSSPAYTLEPSSEDSTSSRISVQSRTSEAGKIKLLIKRPKEVAKQDLPGSSSDEVPKKISLKFKISAKKLVPVPKGDAEGKDRDVLVKEEVDGTLAASVDVATQSAVESILQLNRSDRSVIGVVKQEEPRNTPLSGSLVRRPVIGNGSVFNENYFYGTQNFVETDTEDPGLDEAIQSILG